MKVSISNISWGTLKIEDIGRALKKSGIQGIEIAPTAIWKDLHRASKTKIVEYRKICNDFGLEVSGIQSLMYGHPEFQVFNKSCWPRMLSHFEKVLTIGANLRAEIAVFGSPKNRLKGSLTREEAMETARVFFSKLIPYLQESNVILTLEPNAPDYGADFLTHYEDVVFLSDALNSDWIKPQIDTGCAAMVGEDPIKLYKQRMPSHVHLSAPNLQPINVTPELISFMSGLDQLHYKNWVVLEMLPLHHNTPTAFLESLSILERLINFKMINSKKNVDHDEF